VTVAAAVVGGPAAAGPVPVPPPRAPMVTESPELAATTAGLPVVTGHARPAARSGPVSHRAARPRAGRARTGARAGGRLR